MIASFLATALLVVPLCAATQDAEPSTPRPASRAATQPAPRVPALLDFARHKGVVLAVVDGRSVRLVDLARHLRERYAPDIEARWTDADGSRNLNSPNLPHLLYQYVDVLILRAEAKAKNLPLAKLTSRTDALLERGFAGYLKKLGESRKITKQARAFYLQTFRRENGLRYEVKALLDILVPPNYTLTQLRMFHAEHGRYFGGQVKFAHIFFQTRDPATGRLKSPAELRRLHELARDVRSRIKPDASNFAELARKYSQDKVTGPRGGEFESWARRRNARLPASLVRGVWEIPDGHVSNVLESFYGLHIARRIKTVQRTFLLPSGKTYRRLTGMVSMVEQQHFLTAARKRHRIELRL